MFSLFQLKVTNPCRSGKDYGHIGEEYRMSGVKH